MKNFIIALLLGFGIGIWFGVNIGKGNEFYDNPFSEPTLLEKMQRGAEKSGLMDKSEELFGNGKESIKEQAKKLVEEL